MIKLRILSWRNYAGLCKWAQYNYQDPWKWKREVMWEAHDPQQISCICSCWRWRKGPWAKEWGQLLEAGKGTRMDSSLEPPARNEALMTTLIWVLWDPFQTSDLQNYKTISWCCGHLLQHPWETKTYFGTRSGEGVVCNKYLKEWKWLCNSRCRDWKNFEEHDRKPSLPFTDY